MFKNHQSVYMEAHNNLFSQEYRRNFYSRNLVMAERYGCPSDSPECQPLTEEEINRINNWWMNQYPTLQLVEFELVDTPSSKSKLIYQVHPLTMHTYKVKNSKYTLPTYPSKTLQALKDMGIVMERNRKQTIKFGKIDSQGQIQENHYTIEVSDEGALLRHIVKVPGYKTASLTINPYEMTLMCELVTQWDLSIKNGIDIFK